MKTVNAKTFYSWTVGASVFCLAICSAAYSEYEPNPSILAKRSKILKKTQVEILPAKQEDGKIYVYTQPRRRTTDEIRLLTNAGELVELTGDPSKQAVQDKFECGTRPAATLKSKTGKTQAGKFIAIGPKLNEVIKWIPARPTKDQTPNCIRPKKAFQKENLSVFQTQKSEIRFFIGTWLQPPSLKQMKNWCTGTRDYESCMQDRKKEAAGSDVSAYYQYHRAGIIYGDTCEILSELELDPYPYGHGAGDSTKWGLTGFIGTLILTDKTAKETWYLFDGPGYESSGVDAYLFDESTGKLDTKNPYSVGYDGC